MATGELRVLYAGIGADRLLVSVSPLFIIFSSKKKAREKRKERKTRGNKEALKSRVGERSCGPTCTHRLGRRSR